MKRKLFLDKRSRFAVALFSIAPLATLSIPASAQTTPQDKVSREICEEQVEPQSAKVSVNCRILPGEKVADVQATFACVIEHERIKITTTVKATESPPPPRTPELMSAVETVISEQWPGMPIIPQVSSGATDG